jgi:adenine-specific DNA-methyltransferase
MISLFSKEKKDKTFDYYTYDGNNHCRIFCDNISLDDCYIDSQFYLSDSNSLNMLRDIKMKIYPKYVDVKNGFATLADSVFIGDDLPDSNLTIRVLKASTGKWYKCLFPYDSKGKLLPPSVVLSDDNVREHFEKHKSDLLKGREEYPTFYEFGRTQALLDVSKDKIAINTLLRTGKDLKIEKVDAGCGVYSGLYIITELELSIDAVRNILMSEEFTNYVRLLKKYKSGGYYTFSTKDVQQYLNYKISLIIKEIENDDRSKIFGEHYRIL